MSNSATKLQAAMIELAAAFPAAFTLDPTLVRPMKLGIKDDLNVRSAISHRRIKAALRSYCNSVHYLRASADGAVRIDLAGAPAGTVIATEALHAKEALATLAKPTVARVGNIPSGPKNVPKSAVKARAVATSKASDIDKPVLSTDPATSGPKRLSLGDLKRAATARKAQSREAS
jgi:ProP effector